MKIECTVQELKELLIEKSVDIEISTDLGNLATEEHSSILPIHDYKDENVQCS